MDQAVHEVLHFDRFVLDLTRGCLRTGDRDIDLRPKTFEVLRYLVQNAGRLIPKQELFEAVWQNVVVTDDSLVQCIRELREQLGDDEHRLIKTVSRRGYLLDVAVTASAPEPSRDGLVLKHEGARTVAANFGMAQRILNAVQTQKLRMWGAAAVGLLCIALGASYLLGLFPSAVENPGQGRLAENVSLQPRPTFKDCDICPEMVALPTGEFMMGSPGPVEGPRRRVTLAKRIAVGKFEVTLNQFAAFVLETGHDTGNLCRAFSFERGEWTAVKGSFREPGFRVSGTHPVVCVNWHDARAYVAWLSSKTGQPYRLLTESEWEYAARAGTTTAYNFGEEVTKLCEFARFADLDSRFPWRYGCHSAAFEPGALPVGSLAPNHWGLFDMHGNAWEWVEDCRSVDTRLLPSDASAYRGPEDCKTRVVRGGGWAADANRTRSAYRFPQPADVRYYHMGFRVALSLGE